ncbi:hypothetical protein QYF36_018776 [Acer negundo]|nr:hypothetical protein QYF36_018776 [Acer negundo]
MWKLKIGEDGAWLSSVNDHIGRQHWEFDPHAGTPQELALVETLRSHFNHNRFQLKQSSDLLMRMQRPDVSQHTLTTPKETDYPSSSGRGEAFSTYGDGGGLASLLAMSNPLPALPKEDQSAFGVVPRYK